MAQAAKVNAILGDLVASFATAAGDKDVKKLKATRDAASRAAKAHQYVRTNQFEVEATLDGLIEKFCIINRDDLAGALDKRLIELKARSRSKWAPEILSLFLNLADRPDQKSNVEALELLRPPSPPSPPVTWEELEAEEPLSGEFWLDESYSSASEEEIEAPDQTKTKHKPTSGAPAILVEDSKAVVTETISRNTYKDLEAAQFWTQADLHSSRPQLLSELQVIREVLLMLRGLPTSLFAIDEKNVLIYHATHIMLAQVSLSGLNDILQSLASIGSDLLRLRKWIEQPQSVILLQAFNTAIGKRVQDFDRAISDIERQYTTKQGRPIVISILEVHHDIEVLSRPLVSLGALVSNVPASGNFLCLELLYDQMCALQAAGDGVCFTLLGGIFFECLNVYLRPVALWMEEGTIHENDESFFIAVADKGSSLSSLWHERYTLRMTNDRTLHAPTFLLPAAKKILNAGKSIVFLQHLRKEIPELNRKERFSLTFEKVIGEQGALPLMPFSELFATAFDQWMGSKYGPASTILKKHLFDNCKLLDYVDALEHIYLSKDGTLFQAFADELLSRMSGRKAAWNDKFLLTELARRTFGGIEGIKASSVSVRTMGTTNDSSSKNVTQLASIVLDVNLPWPVQNITQRSSMTTYQSVFTLMLQVYYAKYLLRATSFKLSDGNALNRLAIGIRQQLVWFANIMHSYILEIVVQSAMEKLRENLVNAEDMDAMCESHEIFVKKLELSCLLAKNLAPILDSIIGILDLAVAFAAAKEPVMTDRSNTKSHRTSIANRGRTRQRRSDDMEDGEEDSGEESQDSGDEDEHDLDTRPSEQPTGARLQTIHDKFAQLLHFTVAGLRSVSRAGGQAEWEMLAERLEWGVQKPRHVADYV